MEVKTYVLKDNRTNPVWQLRHKDVMVDFKDPKTKTTRKRQIRYCKGYSTFWDDELPEKAKTTSIDLVNGKYQADANDSVLNSYLQIHPEYGVNYKLLDPEGDAIAELEITDKVDDAIIKLKELSEENRTAVAVSIFGEASTRTSSNETLRLRLRDYIKDTENLLADNSLKAEHFMEVIKSPRTQVMFFVTQALRLDVIEVTKDKTGIRWVQNKGVIMPLASGEDAVIALTEYLLDKKNRNTFEKLKTEIG